MVKAGAFYVICLFVLVETAYGFRPGEFYRGDNLKSISINEITSQVKPGDLFIIGEEHDQPQGAANQIQLMRYLLRNNNKVSVGLEFFDWTQQKHVDEYRNKTISEDEFKKRIQWSDESMNFSNYRNQILFPNPSWGGVTLAMNAPRWLSAKVAAHGLEGLTEVEKKMFPPGFQIGNQNYFKRFKENIGHPLTPETEKNYFLAQSLWDDTMAYQLLGEADKRPEQVMVGIVGFFHVAYGGGLPDRLRVRSQGSRKVWTVLQLNLEGAPSHQAVRDYLSPHKDYGVIADYIWILKSPR